MLISDECVMFLVLVSRCVVCRLCGFLLKVFM